MTTTRTDVAKFELDLGRCSDGGHVFAEMRLDWRRNGPKPDGVADLGISFDHTPKGKRRHQNATSYGQLGDLSFAPGTLGYAVRFVWTAYANNGLHAGCEHQRAADWEREGYDAHKSEPCPVCGYRFGSAWNVVTLPDDVIALVETWQREHTPPETHDPNTWTLPGGTLTLTVVGRRQAPNPTWAKAMNGYEVALRYTPNDGSTARTMRTNFYHGQAITDEPTLDGVMSSMISDSSNASDSFESWCAEFGYDSNNIEAKRTHTATQVQDTKLRNLLGDDYDATMSGNENSSNNDN